MKEELIGPTAALAAALLSRHETPIGGLRNQDIAEAFLQAYEGLQAGIRRVDLQEQQKEADRQSRLASKRP